MRDTVDGAQPAEGFGGEGVDTEGGGWEGNYATDRLETEGQRVARVIIDAVIITAMGLLLAMVTATPAKAAEPSFSWDTLSWAQALRAQGEQTRPTIGARVHGRLKLPL